MGKFQSTKLFDGFSTVFRQWQATDTHCKFLHGYAIEFKVTFEGELDYRNWVWDFGGMKRSKTKIDGMSAKEWMDYMFDHTTVIAKDDPHLEIFSQMHDKGIIQLRVLDGPVGAEKFSEYIFNKLNEFVIKETNGRVKIAQVEFFENKKNTAIYEAD
jgi:6-pyruvoyltetrahydropterin/6-carboxytetrahydropterin synthase